MSLPRISGSFCGIQSRLWLVLAVTLMFIFTAYRFVGDLHEKIATEELARRKLERAVTRLQLDSIDISGRHLSFANDAHGSRQQDKAISLEDDQVIVYNRVPKTGSTSFAGIAYDLCTENKFHVIHMNITRNQRVLGLSDQLRFVKNITNWNEKKPALYHGHVAFIDFNRFGLPKNPIYINLVREPLDRLISYYYFVRYGDDFRPFYKRRKAGDNESFDDCVERDGEDCDPEHLWVQIPYFCGHHEDCWDPGNEWALEEAKRNLLHHYLVVGLTDELRDFFMVLEAVLPRFFHGATELYEEGHKSHLRKTVKKIPPKQSTITRIQQSQIWKMENDFYEFAVNHFHYIRRLTFFENQNREYVEKERRFMFEKIRPR